MSNLLVLRRTPRGARVDASGRAALLSTGMPAMIRVWVTRSRQRRELREVAERDDHLLADIGLTRAEAFRKAAKWFWQP